MNSTGSTTPAQLLVHALERGLDRLDAQLLLLHALGRAAHDRAWLMAHDSDELPATVQAAFDHCVQRRLSGEPVAYITGHKEFFGLNFQVDSRVLVPRPDTETLVEWTLELLPANGSVIDLGTGSGAIALALKHARADARVSAVDASADALALARLNAQHLQLDVTFTYGNWLYPVDQAFDLIVSNPPYIAVQDPHLAALKHEPQQALTSGLNGLYDIRKIIIQAPAHLLPGGWLLLEHGYNQAGLVHQLLIAAGFADVQSRLDLNGIERCSGGRVNPSA
jgi:release factor glutamine methyltransferase